LDVWARVQEELSRGEKKLDQTLGGIYLFVVVFLVVLAILWFLLPFAIFGTKPKLDQLIAETRKTNAELERLREQISVPRVARSTESGSSTTAV
jgi:cell division protein FtsL